METKYGFTLLSITEFENWIKDQAVARTVLFLQQHHTFSPGYAHFNGVNHFDLQKGMKNHHVNNNGWADIGQHFSIFPDGKICTGRTLESSPACIYGRNANAICIENVGYFDIGKDNMTPAQKDSIVRATAAICKRFKIPVTTDYVVYHHWFDLSSGARTNGSGNTKSCPGTAFFGGNKVADCEANFLPLVRAKIGATATTPKPLPASVRYGYVSATTLNIRKGSNSTATVVGSTTLGSVLRIYDEQNGWLKISSNNEEWVYANFVKEVKRAVVNADVLNVRSGAGATFSKIGSVLKGQEVFVYEDNGEWSKIGIDERWINTKYITF